MEDLGNPIQQDHSLSVVLPCGLEKSTKVHGSEPVMDLLVTLCARYHLNPSNHTVEVLSPNKNNIHFKPNSPIGSLEADTIVLKPKGAEDSTRRPYTPEATVRLLINYRRSHKTVVRVNPRVPLQELAAAISEKCEFQRETTILLRDAQSPEPLDLAKSLNELGLRELFAKDTAVNEVLLVPEKAETIEVLQASEMLKPSSPHGPLEDHQPKKEIKRRETKRFLTLFRRGKEKVNVPASPGHNKTLAVSVGPLELCPAGALPVDVPKKRPAPQPPLVVSQSVPNNIGTHRFTVQQGSAESTLRRTKRRAPLPPCANSHLRPPADTEEITGTSNSPCAPEQQKGSCFIDLDRTESPPSVLPPPSSSSSSSSSSSPSSLSSSTRLVPGLKEGHNATKTRRGGEELSYARSALAQILTSSLSNGKLVKHLSSTHSSKFFYHASASSRLPSKCRGGGGGGDPHPGPVESGRWAWEDRARRRGSTTFTVVPSRVLEQGPAAQGGRDLPGDDASTKAGESLTAGDPEVDLLSPGGGPAPETSAPHRGAAPVNERVSDAPPSPKAVADRESRERPGTDAAESTKARGHAGVRAPGTPPGETAPGCGDEVTGEVASPYLGVSDPQPKGMQVDQAGSEPGGEVDQAGSEPGGEVDQAGSEPGGEVDQAGSEPGGEVDQESSEPDAWTIQDEEDDPQEEEDFPPPPPPLLYDDQQEVLEEKVGGASILLPPSSSPPLSSRPSSRASNSGTLTDAWPDHPTPPAAPSPRERVTAAPSRFAQAVALAVQRNRFQSRGRNYGNLFTTVPSGQFLLKVSNSSAATMETVT